jgi:hypothetical protein
MEIVGKAVFANAGDESGFMYQASVARHEGRLWLVATWLAPNGPGEQVPGLLLPMEAAGHWNHEEGGTVWTAAGVAPALAGPSATEEAMLRAGAVLNPALVRSLKPSGPRH